MKGGRKHKTDKRRINKKALIVGVALAVIMVGGAVAAVLMNSPSTALNKDNNKEVIQRIVSPISENVPVLAAGSGSSNITMVEFGDYQCQYCARFHNETKNQIISNLVDTGQIENEKRC